MAKKSPPRKKVAKQEIKEISNPDLLKSDMKGETEIQAFETFPQFSRSRALLPFNRVPEWSADNKFVTHGFRPINNSVLACYESWFYLHNESINIFSHLLPSIFGIFILGSLNTAFFLQYPKADYGDYLILTLFFITAIICFGLSATYHTLICHSQKIEAVWLRADFIGIILLTMGIFLSAIVLSFKCHLTEQKIYCSMISTLGILSITILISPRFQGPKFRTFRTLTFVGTGLSGIAPIVHGIFLYGFTDMFLNRGVAYYLGEGVIFLLGVFFYITRIPESIAPGRFNNFGHSHQIFHTLVVLATVVHLFGLLKVFEYNYERTCLA